MSGRVSIKGQGADIFFGEADKHVDDPKRAIEPSQAANAGSKRLAVPSQESQPASKEAGQPVSQQASLPVSQQASLPVSQQDSKQAPSAGKDPSPLSASSRRRLRDLLEREHRTHNTYRYHEEELAAVRDIVYELEVRRGVKVSRNDVMRAALLLAIEDYNTRGDENFLLQLLQEGDRRLPPAER
ncbi:MAG: hypothetical protein ACREMY_06775 [bacterium]